MNFSTSVGSQECGSMLMQKEKKNIFVFFVGKELYFSYLYLTMKNNRNGNSFIEFFCMD